MRTLGLIGGMSWESTQSYYALINQGVRASLGGLHSAEIILHSVDFGPIEAMQANGEWKRAGARLAGIGRRLEMAGADALILCTNTMHKVAGPIEQATSVPFLHISEITRQAIQAAGYHRVALLGTRYAMEESFLTDRLAGDTIRVDVPESSDREVINRVIFDELCQGVVNAESRRRFEAIIEGLADQGAEAVILGCTEIGLLVDAETSPVPLFDTTRLHTDAAVAFALGDQPETIIGR